MLDQTKPHKGTIVDLLHRESDYARERGTLGYYIRCVFLDHPDFAGNLGHTSVVMKQEDDQIETLNSRYTVVSLEEAAKDPNMAKYVEKF